MSTTLESVSSEDSLPECPFPGIESFTYARRRVFFAREEEIRALSRSIVLHRGVLLYAASGTGKSSLINAGIIPAAMQEGFQPERIRVQPKVGQEIVVEPIRAFADERSAILPSIFMGANERLDRVVLSVKEFLTCLHKTTGTVRPLLIFDQFEEWVTLFEETSNQENRAQLNDSRETIQTAISKIINDASLPVKVLIALREDYLANLAPLFRDVPSLPDNYLRLRPLSPTQLTDVIRKPYEKYPGAFGVELSPALAEKIRDQFEDRVAGGEVQLTEVQIVCRTLFEHGAKRANVDQLFAAKGVQGILEEYIESTLNGLKGAREPALAVLSRLITSSGTRNVVSEDNLIRWLGNEDKIPPGIVRTALRNLEHSARLIRCEPRRGVNYYEINSEFLVPWIQREAIARETQRQVYDLSQQEAKKQRERFQKIRLRVMYAVAGGVILIALMMVSRYKNEKTLRLHSVADNLAVRALMDSGEIGQLLATEAVAIDDKEDRSHFSGLIGTALGTALSSPLAPLRKFAGAVGSISTDTAGRLLAATADSRIMLWDLAHSRSNPESIGEFEFATFQSVALSRDGSQLVAGTHDGRLFLWQLGGNRGEPEIFDADTSTVYGVDISPDGHRVAAASRDGLIRIWDLGQGEQSRRNLPTGGLMAWSVRFANDGKTLFTGSVKGGIQRWDLRTQKPVAGLPGVSLDLSADGMWLASGTIDGKIRVWRTSDLQKPEREIEAHRGAVRSVALSRDGSELASAGEDSTVQVWDVRSSTPVRTMLGMHHGWATSVRFTHDGNGLHSGGIDGELKRWVDVRGRNEYPVTVSPQRGDRGTVSSAAMNMSAGVVVALVSKRSPSLPWLFGSGPLGSERMAAASTSGGSVQLYDLGSETGLRQLAAGAKNLAIALSGDGKSVAIADHDSVRILRVDESNLRPVAFGQAKDSLTVLALSGDGIQLAAAGQDNVVRVWDTRQPGKTPKRLRGVSGKVRSLTFSADAKSIAAGSDSGVVRVWGLARPDTSLEIEAHVGMVRSLTFSSDGQLLASGGNDGKVSIWNLADPHKTAVVFPAGEAAVTAVLFRKDDRLIFAGSSDGTIDFWSMQEGNASPARLDTHAGAVRAIALSERSDTLYSIGVDGRVLGWIINRQGLAKRICERVGRNLSFAEWRLFVPSDIRYELPCPEHGSPPENIDAIKKAIRQGDDGNARRMRKAISKLDSSQEYDVDAGIKFFRAEQLARSGQVDSAIAVAREVTSLSSSSAQRREGLDDVVAVLIARAKALTDSGNYRETNQLVTKITAFSADGGKLAAREISRIVQPIILDPALKLAEAGQVDSALVLFEQARTLLGDDKIPPYYWNDLCWYGALWRRAPDIMRACEQAVKMRPLDGHYRDSRGVARALSGDRAGAIEDFAYYIGFSDDSIIKRDREQWIKTLRAKGDPFTPKVLQGLLRD